MVGSVKNRCRMRFEEVSQLLQQQGRAPAHRTRETVALLTRETPDFIPPTLGPPNSLDLNPVDYKVWSVLQESDPRRGSFEREAARGMKLL